ncbi:MAG: Ldh family oxidoreductase [Chloroflexi bacterium]|nr:Ldh family oxidoreductase [Chloroflexota bacterium]MDA1174104.1 Ldh family oxidoreductase [Chloroflexota bacterium]
MLDRFHVSDDIAVRVSEAPMRATVEDIFRKMGMNDEDSVQSADVLLYADIRGIDSHGVSNMLRQYVADFGTGSINPRPEWKIVREAPAIVNIDGDRGHGLVLGPVAMRIAIERAKLYGIGAVTVGNSRHSGAAAYHAAMALDHGMIGIAMTTGSINMTPTNGAARLLGLNPIACAVPTLEMPPFVFDAAMSAVASNKIRLARRLGVKTLPGWIAQLDGTPIMEEQEIPEESMMLPSGGTRENGSHKSYGLAVMVEVLTSAIAGTGAGPHRRAGISHHMIAYNIEAFTDLDVFKKDMDEYMRTLSEAPTAPGADRVVYAGLPEHEAEIDRRENGIPYHPEVIEWFKSITAELGIEDRL